MKTKEFNLESWFKPTLKENIELFGDKIVMGIRRLYFKLNRLPPNWTWRVKEKYE